MARGLGSAARSVPKVLRVAGTAVTIFGAAQEAAQTAEVAQWNAGGPNTISGTVQGALGFVESFAVGVAAGAIDDALVGIATSMGATQAITDQYQGFAGPAQQLAGRAFRGILNWSVGR